LVLLRIFASNYL